MPITLTIYSTGTTAIFDSAGELAAPEGLWFQTCNKGGLYLAAGCYVPRTHANNWWEVDGAKRAVIRYGLTTIYEGWIVGLNHMIDEDAEGVQIEMIGAWGNKLMRVLWGKVWADDRVDEQQWQYQTSSSGADKCTVQRDSRIKFLPKSETWASSDYAAVRYNMYDTIARVIYYFELEPFANAKLALFRSPDGSTWTQMTAISGETYNAGSEATTVRTTSTSGTPLLIDVEPAAGTKQLELRLINNSGTPTTVSDGSEYASITSLMVYSEDEGATGIRLYSVCQDAITDLSSIINSDATHLTEMGTVKVVEPFMVWPVAYISDVLYNICQFGDGNNDPWTVGVLASDIAVTPDGKPVLYCAAIPDVTDGDYEYILDLSDDRVVPGVELKRDFVMELFNTIFVTYRDLVGWTQMITPSMEATLADATSVAAWGRIDYRLDLGYSTYADALAQGVRFLNQHKDPKWRINGSLRVTGSLDDGSGQCIPAAMVNAYQKRIKIIGYDTFLVTMTEYDADSDTVSISLGAVEDVTSLESSAPITWDDAPSGGGSGSGRSGGSQPWWKILDEIGARGRRRMKEAGTWDEYKREGLKRFKEKRRNRG